MQSILIRLSGARPALLRESPGNRPVYLGISGTILTSAIAAGVSIVSVLATAFRVALPLAIVLGLLWGLVTLNLDRWLVVSLSRRDSAFRLLADAVPRLLIALLFGYVSSLALILLVFRPEISAYLHSVKSSPYGLLANVQALGYLTAHNQVLNSARWILFTLSMLLDCLPVIAMTMLYLGPKTAYEQLCDQEDRMRLRVAHERTVRRQVAKVVEADAILEVAQKMAAARAEMTSEIIQETVNAERRVIKKVVSKWADDLLESVSEESASFQEDLDRSRLRLREETEALLTRQAITKDSLEVLAGRISPTDSPIVTSPEHRPLWQAFTDGVGATFDVLGVVNPRSKKEDANTTLAEDAHAICVVLELMDHNQGSGSEGARS